MKNKLPAGRTIIMSFIFLIVLLSFVNASLHPVAENKNPPKPNIIFLLTDDQRWDAMGAMDNPIIQTPNIDKLAAAGALFANAYVTTSILAMAGVPAPKQMQGVDLFAELQNKIPERSDFFYQHYFLGGSRIPRVEGIVTKDFKYMNYVEHNYEELFDTVHDPHETTNLAKDHKPKMKLEELRPFHEFRLPSHSIYL